MIRTFFRATTALAVAVTLTTAFFYGVRAEDPAAKKSPEASTVAAVDKSLDFTDESRAMNSDRFAAPPTKFRGGHVTPRSLDENVLNVNDKGYSIQLPSKAPISTPTVYNGKIYVGGGFHSKEFYCFDAATGKLVWGRDLDDDGPSSAVCSDGVVIFNTESCTIFALNAETGDLLWSHWLGDPLTSAPAIADGKVFSSYPASGRADGQADGAIQQNANAAPPKPAEAKPNPQASHALACFDLKTGKILWQRWIDSDVMSAPVAVDGELFVTSFAGIVYKFKQSDGTILSATRSRATSAPIVVDHQVVVTKRADAGGEKDAPKEQIAGLDRSSNATTFAGDAKDAKYLDPNIQANSALKASGVTLDAANGFGGGLAPISANATAAVANAGVSNVSTMQAFQGSRPVYNGGFCYNSMGNEFLCSNAATGKTEWKLELTGDLEKMGGALASPPAAVADQIFLATLQGEVLRLDAKAGKILEKYAVGSPIRAQPAIEGGRIFVGTFDGKLVCIDTRNPKFTGWSTWGGNAAHTGVAAK